MLDIELLKSIDRLAGTAAARCLPAATFQAVEAVKQVLFVRPGGIGDAVLLAFAINSVKETYPDCQITILAEKRNAEVFRLVPCVAKVLCYDRPEEFIQVFLRSYDVVIDTEQWYRLPAVVARVCRARVKIGFATNNRKRMFTHGVQYDLDAYESDNFSALLEPLGVLNRGKYSIPALSLPYQAMLKAEQLLQQFCSADFAVIFPGASLREKRWGVERFSQVAKWFGENGISVVVVGGEQDRGDGDFIIDGGLGINLAGRTTLVETAAVIDRSALVVGGDSGIIHIAAGLGVSTISLFGPSSPLKWAPRGDMHSFVNNDMPCSPCSMFGTIPECGNNVCCITNITPAEVIAAIRKLPLRQAKNRRKL